MWSPTSSEDSPPTSPRRPQVEEEDDPSSKETSVDSSAAASPVNSRRNSRNSEVPSAASTPASVASSRRGSTAASPPPSVASSRRGSTAAPEYHSGFGGTKLRFEIPMGDDDLTVADEGAFHVVEQGDLDEERVASEIEQFEFKLTDRSQLKDCLKEHFDAFFSLAKINSKIKKEDMKLRLSAVRALLNYFQQLYDSPLYNCLCELIRWDGQPPPTMLDEACLVSNLLLMNIYLLNRLTIHLENEFMRRQLAAEKKKGVRKAEMDDDMEKWCKWREKIIANFTSICELSIVDREDKLRVGAIRYLWRPPEANKGMILAFTETVFKLLENPQCKTVAAIRWLEKIFQLVRAMCIKFDYFSRMAVALVEKTVTFEYLKDASVLRYPFIQPILNVATKNKDEMEPLLIHMIHHLGDLIDMEIVALTPKPYALLMMSMAELAPEVMIKQLSAVVPFLKKDVNSLRSAVLSVFSSLLCSTALTEQNCQQFSRRHKVRTSMLNFLMDHLHDSNAMTRSRAVNIWSNLAENQRIPQDFLKRALISKIGERLVDKSVQVRKAAVHFLTKFLEGNPYGHDFNYELHKKKLYELSCKRRNMLKHDPSMATMQEAEAEYDKKEAEVKMFVEKYVQQHIEGTADEVSLQGAEVADTMIAISTQVLKSPEYCVQVLVYLVYSRQLDSVQPEEDFTRTVHNVCECMRNLYLRTRVNQRKSDDDALLEEEERQEDYQRDLSKLERDMHQLRDKMIVAMEFANCLPVATISVLNADLAEQREGMSFIVKCKQFNVTGADAAVRMLCSLIWRNSENDIRTEVLKTAQQLFISTHHTPEVRVKSTVMNLVTVLEGMKDEERACVEEVICCMAQSEKNGLPQGIYKHVWKIVDNSEQQMKMVSLQLYGILTRADKSLRRSLRNLQSIIRDKTNNPRVRSEALAAIAHMADECRRADIMDKVFRIPAQDSLFSTVENFVVEELYRPPSDSSVWCDVFHNALTICFDIGKDTCMVASRLMAKVLTHTHRVSEAALFYTAQVQEEKDEQRRKPLKEQRRIYTRMMSYVTERCLVMCGEIALRTVVHVDLTYTREVKRLPDLVNLVRNGELQPSKASDRQLKDWEFRAAMHKGMFDYSSKDESNPGTSDEDRVRSRADQIIDFRLFRDGKLLPRIIPFVMYCLRSEGSPECVRNAAAVAFSKIMMVSKEFSGRAAPAFFMLLNNAESPIVRNNLMIASADLCVRMPNLIESYASNLYLMTNDAEPIVRETAILVLNHLLTNGLLKTRGCLADVAKLYTDEIPSISTLTGEFFYKLREKDNGTVIYNLMPDFVSRLTKNAREVSLAQFKTIMSYLMTLLNKDKMDALVERTCKRFEQAKTPNPKNKEIAHYFSFCISQLQLSEKSFYKMRDSLNNYKEFLEDQVIFRDFQTPLLALAKNAKNTDVASDISDFLEVIEKMHSRGLRTDELNIVKRMQDKKAARSAAKRAVSTRPKRKRVRFDSEDDEDEEE